MGRPSSYEEEDPEVTERKKEAAGYFHRGVELERKGRYAEALSSYEKSRELGDRNFTSFKRGDIYYEMGDYEGALECYRKYGKNEGALSAAAKALEQLGRYDEALNNYFEVLGMIEANQKYVLDHDGDDARGRCSHLLHENS
jgi:tetratricopeptide (TPR) repeat protein